MLREEYVVEIIRGLCEKNKIKWQSNKETDLLTAEINNMLVSVSEGWRGLVFIQLREKGSDVHATIIEPMLIIRPNSPAWKIRAFINKRFFQSKLPGKLEKQSADMQFILEYAQKNAVFQATDHNTLFDRIAGFK